MSEKLHKFVEENHCLPTTVSNKKLYQWYYRMKKNYELNCGLLSKYSTLNKMWEELYKKYK